MIRSHSSCTYWYCNQITWQMTETQYMGSHHDLSFRFSCWLAKAGKRSIMKHNANNSCIVLYFVRMMIERYSWHRGKNTITPTTPTKQRTTITRPIGRCLSSLGLLWLSGYLVDLVSWTISPLGLVLLHVPPELETSTNNNVRQKKGRRSEFSQ